MMKSPTPARSPGWTHAICVLCWHEMHPGPGIVTGGLGEVETCCRCGHWTTSGIYLRGDPAGYTFCAHR
jgi:hypothetical protein